jgi:hypothetical protein
MTKQSLKDKGHDVTNVWNGKQTVTNKPLPTHFIYIKHNDTNKEIYKINTILHTIVQLESPHPKREVP